ncbi:MAG: N-acetylmuramoyl-L-alanine amidase [Planctomycetes bacterium]|nr:N-acetylmuramoyl-L-alanine amidase [Planctomycetota bacterium]
MVDELTRRGLLVGGAVLFITGCSRTARTSAGATAQPTFPPYAGSLRTPAVEGLWYRVAAGDTLASISRRSGVEVGEIARANGLTDAALKPGTPLWLPGATTIAATAGVEDPEDAAPPARARRPGTYELVERSGWTDNPVRKNNYRMNGVKRITIHHTGEHPGLEGIPEIEVLRRIERYHQNERKWAAIGYHYLVGKSGTVYEGRPAKYQGAHVSGANEHNLGISVVGDFMRKLPNPEQLAALDAFLTDTRERFSVPKSRVFGHRELGKSDCCGDALFRWIQTYRA